MREVRINFFILYIIESDNKSVLISKTRVGLLLNKKAYYHSSIPAKKRLLIMKRESFLDKELSITAEKKKLSTLQKVTIDSICGIGACINSCNSRSECVIPFEKFLREVVTFIGLLIACFATGIIVIYLLILVALGQVD